MKRLPILQLTFFLLAAVCFACSNEVDDSALYCSIIVGENGDPVNYPGTWYIGDQAVCEANLTNQGPLSFDNWPAKEITELVITDAQQIYLQNPPRFQALMYANQFANSTESVYYEYLSQADSVYAYFNVVVDSVAYYMMCIINVQESSMVITTTPSYEMDIIVRLSAIVLVPVNNEGNERRRYPTQIATKFVSYGTSRTPQEEE